MKYFLRAMSLIVAFMIFATPILADDKHEPAKSTHLIVDPRVIKILIKSLDSVTTQEEARQLLGEADYIFKEHDHQIWEYKWEPFRDLDIKLELNQTVSSLGGFTLKFDKATGKKVFWGWIYSQQTLEPISPELQKQIDRLRDDHEPISEKREANKPAHTTPDPP